MRITDFSPKPIRYRVVDDGVMPGPRRVRVVLFRGWEGYVHRWTDYCSGCTEHGDYGTQYGPFGCDECGYTGKRRNSMFVAFDRVAYEKWSDSRWERRQRLERYFRERRRAA